MSEQEVDMAAVESAVDTAVRGADGKFAAPKYARDTGLPVDMDKALDDAINAVPDHFREEGRLPPRTKEQPKAKAETPEPEVVGEEAGTADSPKETAGARNPKVEEALVALRLAGFEDADLDGMADDRVLRLGVKVKANQAQVSEKFQKQAAELKKAQEAPAKETTGKEQTPEAESEAAPDLAEALQAFKEYGDDFTKPMDNFGRALSKMTRESVMSEIRPAAEMLSEMSGIVSEMLQESVRREFEGRFPQLVEDKEAWGEATKAYKRLWGEGGATYADAAETRLGRVRACMSDACRLTLAAEGPRKDDSKKARGLPAAPARQVPKKSLTTDEELDADIDAVEKRWAGR